MKYAQINFDTLQMVSKVYASLPTRWTTSDGATISQFNLLPQAALYGLGWVPVVYEEIENAETHKYSLSPTYDEENKQFVFEAVAIDIDKLKSEACDAIDQAASDACARYISTGVGQEMRYLQKSDQAAAFVTAYDAGEDPDPEGYPFVKAEAEACGEDCITRARYIVETTEAWITAGTAIESTRMGGKTSVNNATTNDDVIAFRDTTLAALEEL